MGRLLQVLIPIFLLTAAIAGCIGGDEDPSGPSDDGGNGNNGNDNETKDPDNQTTEPAPVPVPVIDVTMAGGEEGDEEVFFASPKDEVTFTLNGSGSTVENGTIDVYVWTVTRPDGSEERGTPGENPEFEVVVNGTANPQDFGVYTAALRVLSDQGEIAETTKQWTLSLSHRLAEFEGTLLGPSQDCSDPQDEGQGAIPDPVFGDIVLGTYFTHSIRVGENATGLTVTLDVQAGAGSEAKLYIYDPETAIEETNCGDAAAESDTGTGELTASLEGGLMPGQHSMRVQLVGATLEDYTLDVEVVYDLPGDGDGEEGEEGEE